MKAYKFPGWNIVDLERAEGTGLGSFLKQHGFDTHKAFRLGRSHGGHGLAARVYTSGNEAGSDRYLVDVRMGWGGCFVLCEGLSALLPFLGSLTPLLSAELGGIDALEEEEGEETEPLTVVLPVSQAELEPGTDAVADLSQEVVVECLRFSLRERSKRTWSVRCGEGEAHGWIYISAPRARMKGGVMAAEAREELAQLLGLDQVPPEGISIPPEEHLRREYMNRADTGSDGGESEAGKDRADEPGRYDE